MSSSECEAAAEYLGLSDTSATPADYGISIDPPYCYFEYGFLLFNGDGTNTGACGGEDKCLCKSSSEQRNVPEPVCWQTEVKHVPKYFKSNRTLRVISL